MQWNERLKQEVPREQIPAFLDALQGLVAALREGRWDGGIPERLQSHADLVLAYLQDGPKKAAVRAALRAQSNK